MRRFFLKSRSQGMHVSSATVELLRYPYRSYRLHFRLLNILLLQASINHRRCRHELLILIPPRNQLDADWRSMDIGRLICSAVSLRPLEYITAYAQGRFIFGSASSSLSMALSAFPTGMITPGH